MKYYCEDAESVLSEVGSSQKGLSSEEAAKRLERDGRNELAAAKKPSLISQFFKQMADPMIIILLVAAAISAVTSVYQGEGAADVIIILFVVIVNAVLGVYQENKAEKAIEALQAMSAATSRVLRGGKVAVVPSAELVVGDVVLLEAGDAVPADGRLLESASLKIEEAALTGESVPVTKFIDILDPGSAPDVPLGDRKNMMYMGSTVVYGRGTAVVTATGMDTEMGRIADALSKAEQGQTAADKAQSAFEDTHLAGAGHMRRHLRRTGAARRGLFRRRHPRLLPGGGLARGRRNTGGTCGSRDRRAVYRRHEYVEAQRDHTQADGGRDSGLRTDNLFG